MKMKYTEQAVETLDDAGSVIANKNIEIEQLRQRVAELEKERDRLSGLCDKWNFECDEMREDNKRLANVADALMQQRDELLAALTDKHDIDYLKQVFSYDPETGEITWKIRRGNMIVGTIAGSVWGDGYRYIRFDGTLYLAHRIAFAMYHGRYPEAVDHINMVRDDNRISNLREATVAENNRNKRIQSNNSSGYKGVTLHKPSGKFQAKIMFDGKTESLGYFDTKEDAAIAYENAARKLNGEFYCQTLPLPPDDVVRDAERYKWLRKIAPNIFWDNHDKEIGFVRFDTKAYLWKPEMFDAAIDAAMKEMK